MTESGKPQRNLILLYAAAAVLAVGSFMVALVDISAEFRGWLFFATAIAAGFIAIGIDRSRARIRLLRSQTK